MFDNANLIKDLIQENAHLRKMIHTFVFCKDCEHWNAKEGYCYELDVEEMENDDFCSRGERKNTNEDVAW